MRIALLSDIHGHLVALDAAAGAPQIRLSRVTHDLNRYADEVRRSGMPHGQWWLDKWRPAPA